MASPSVLNASDLFTDAVQFHNYMQQLQEELSSLRVDNSQLTASVQQLREAALVSSPTATAPLIHSSPFDVKIKMKTPDTFDGGRDFSGHKVSNFLSQCQLYIDNTSAFTSDDQKIRFAASYLRGEAYTWISSYLALDDDEKSKDVHAWLSSWKLFKEKLQTTFGDPDKEATESRKLYSLRQTTSAAAYAAEFRRLSLSTGWNDEALRFHFVQGLRENIKDEFARIDVPETFDECVEKAITIDNRYYVRAKERREPLKNSTPLFSTPLRTLARPPTSFPRSTTSYNSRPPTTFSVRPEDRMQVDASRNQSFNSRRGPLTQAEKDYRRLHNLCSFCGKSGHYADTCHSLGRKYGPNNSSYRSSSTNNKFTQPVKSSATFTISSPNCIPLAHYNPVPTPSFSPQLTIRAVPTTSLEAEHLILPITLSHGSNLEHTYAMVDTGSQGVLMDERYARALQIPLLKRQDPISIEAYNGQPAENLISHYTSPVTLQIGDHYELIEFNIATVAHYPVILGIPWIRKHDVSILPSENRILFASSYCSQHCLPLSNSANALPRHPALSSAAPSPLKSAPLTAGSPSKPLTISNTTLSSSRITSSSHSESSSTPPAANSSSSSSSPTDSDQIESLSSSHPVNSRQVGSIPSSIVDSGPVESPLSTPSQSSSSSSSSSSPKVEKPPQISLVNIAAINLAIRQGAQLYTVSPINLPTRLRLAASHLRDPTSTPNSPTLSTTEIDELRKVVPIEYHDFLDVFSKDSADTLPQARSGIDHSIDIEAGKEIPTSRIYPLSANELEVLADYIETNLKSGFIRPSQSPVGAPILFVKKKDGSLRLCVDYRGLNSVTIKNKYPLPLINETLDRLIGARYFTKIDLRNGYHHVRIRVGDEWKTAFRTRYGHYEYQVMPFGLTNAPATFQALINDTFRPFLDRFVVAYLDDILIYSQTLEEHQDHVRQVLAKMREAKLYGKAEKCSFHSDSVEYLGFIINRDGVSMDPSKVQSIREWPQPSTVKEVQSFLGFANFYRRFIRNYSSIAAPLTRLTRKDIIFEMDKKAIEAFNILKNSFESDQILRHFDPSLPLELETDASDFALGAVLSQRQSDNKLYPIAFLSRNSTPPELNYEVHDKELLAIVEACKAWRPYLSHTRSPTTIFSDHFNLKYFFSSKTLNRRQARWQEALSELNFTLVHRPGKQQGKTDALSRRSDYQEGTRASDSEPVTFFPPSKISSSANFVEPFPPLTSEILRLQDTDPELTQVLQDLRLKENLNNHSPLWKLGTDQILRWNDKIYIPNDNALRIQILQSVHDDPSAGHPGIEKTFERFRRNFYFPQDRQFITNYVTTCEPCFRAKSRRTKAHGLLQPLPVPTRPWSSISLDFIVKLPTSEFHNDSILVITDRFTKYGIFIPCKEEGTTAQVFANLFYRYVFANHGLPNDIVSDRGSVFTSDFWTTLSRLTRTKLNLSTAFHPQTDGATERLNQTLEQFLRIYTNYQQDDWELLLPLAQFVYNDTIHSATNTTPFFANYGFHPRFSVDLSVREASASASQRSALARAKELQDIHDCLRQEIERANVKMKTSYDLKKSPSPTFQIGDTVWLSSKNIQTRRQSKKLDHKFLGPFKILEKIGPLAYRLDLPTEIKIHPVFHVSLLHRHKPNTLPDRIPPPPPPVIVSGETQYEVEQILDSRRYRGQLQYKVRWKNYGVDADSWEPSRNVSNSMDLVLDFHRRNPSRPQPSPRKSKPTKQTRNKNRETGSLRRRR
ncbi:hypothetical protein JCM3765_001266 [Sporobolomyces pararoseus]